ncbi:glycosyltransferase family 87 protein [Candidatus Blastococcus massiliensis]|uniref:glycosyltransferase family 87 protein n=1 Tax=Candidatus Blastococcus massiliensis TaxID=1470358 RepID=UPI0004B8BA2B|nr:glycosyltransferase family 87 protein [Candidatus Blastococcus massiliensis]
MVGTERWSARADGGVRVALWALAAVAFAVRVVRSFRSPDWHFDFEVLYGGALNLLERQSVYSDEFFLLTPSGLLAMAPFGLLDHDPAFYVWNTVSVLAVVLGVVLTLRLLGEPLGGSPAAGLVLALSILPPMSDTWHLGNINNSFLFALAAAFLIAVRNDRRVLAGICLGLALAIKPVLVLLVVIPLLRRNWSTLAWAAAIPAVLNVAGLAVTPNRREFFDITVPGILHAREEFNSSLWAAGRYLDIPGPLVDVLRVAAVAAAVVVVWQLRRERDEVLALAVGSGALLLATFLSSSLSQAYYALFLVPLLMSVVRPGSPMRNPLAWVAVLLFTEAGRQVLDGSTVPDAFAVSRVAAGWGLLLVVVLVWTLRRRTTSEEPALGDADLRRPAHV